MSREAMKPVAWTDEDFTELIVSEDIAKDIGATVPLYASPPQRKPLTDEQMEQIHQQYGGNIKKIMRAVEAAHGITGEQK